MEPCATHDDAAACGPCEKHSQCSSRLCDKGQCLTTQSIIYVAPRGSCTSYGQASLEQPECNWSHAMTKVVQARRIIHVAPGVYDQPLLTAPPLAQFVGEDYPLIQVAGRPGLQGAIWLASQEGLHMRGFRIKPIGEDTSAPAAAIYCSGKDANVHLEDSILEPHAGMGISASNGCGVYLDRVTIRGNRKGGVQVDSGTLLVVNTMLIGNGSNSEQGGSAFGGMAYWRGQGPLVFVNNTVVGNRSLRGTSGAYCSPPLNYPAASVVQNNIFWDHGGFDLNEECNPFSSNIEGSRQNGLDWSATNMSLNPWFQNAAQGDFHIQFNSPMRNKGARDRISITYDIDGQMRDDAPDIGADEVQ